MQTRDETKDFSPQMLRLYGFITALSDMILVHINKLDSRLGLFASASIATVRRDTSKIDEPFYDIRIHSKVLEVILHEVLVDQNVPIEYDALGINIKEKDIEQHPQKKNFYDELLKSCQAELNAPLPKFQTKTYAQFPSRHAPGLFHNKQSMIGEVIYNFGYQQQLRRGQ